MQDVLKLPLKFTWKDGPDMPYGKCGYVQSVLIQGKLYVGGGEGLGTDRIVMEYDVASKKWTNLKEYQTTSFAMAVLNNQLVLVGGYDHGRNSKVLSGHDKVWTHPYLEMLTARSSPSVVGYKEWLVVAGGQASGRQELLCVEVLNTGSKQWYTGPPTPSPWQNMKTLVIEDQAYFMGGHILQTIFKNVSNNVYQLDIHNLISSITSQKSSRSTDQQIWKKITPLSLTESAPLTIGGSLLAIGGGDKGEASTAIYLYSPQHGTWEKIGDLPFPRTKCTCAMISNREMIVAGGVSDYLNALKSVHIALILC